MALVVDSGGGETFDEEAPYMVFLKTQTSLLTLTFKISGRIELNLINRFQGSHGKSIWDFNKVA